jgi:hypothetical protein
MAIQYLYAIYPAIVRELNTLLTAEILTTIYDLAQVTTSIRRGGFDLDSLNLVMVIA